MQAHQLYLVAFDAPGGVRAEIAVVAPSNAAALRLAQMLPGGTLVDIAQGAVVVTVSPDRAE